MPPWPFGTLRHATCATADPSLASPRCEDTCVTCGGMLLCITCAGLNWKRAAVREPWGGCLWHKSAEALKERGWKRGQQVDEAESMSMSSVSK